MSRRVLLAGAAVIGAGAVTALVAEILHGRENDELGDPVVPHMAMEKKEVVSETDLLQAGPWQYMAGVRVVAGGLELSPTGLSIVNKREGGSIDPNPPLNVFGPRLQAEGDFAVTAHVQGNTPVSLQLYGQVPLRFDDFRYERSRVECQTAGNTLTVRIWDGSKQEPSILQHLRFGGSPTDRQVEIRREGAALAFVINGKQIASLPQGQVFKSGEVWLGINSEQDRARVNRLTARPLHGHKLAIVNTASQRLTQPLPEGLQSLVHKPGFRIGAAAALNPMMSDASYAQLFLGGELGSITTENALKPQDVQPTEHVFTFGEADALIALAQRHGLSVHGHTLVYSKALPPWMQRLPTETQSDKRRVREVLETHVHTTAKHFRGRIGAWDVGNEFISGFNHDARLEENVFYRALGEKFIDIAFHVAHDADPNARLYLNDYGMETNPQGRGRFMLSLAEKLLARSVPLHGIGIEGHVYKIPRDTIKPQILSQLMQDVSSLGLDVRVSELDVTGANGAKAQAQQYADILRACLQAPNCTGLTMWGLDDLHGSTAGVRNGQLRPGNALPYTARYQPKRARRAMLAALLR